MYVVGAAVMTSSSRSVMGSKRRLRVDKAVSCRGCCGCAVMHHRGEWTQECPTHGKVPRRVREVFSTGFGLEASKLSFVQKH